MHKSGPLIRTKLRPPSIRPHLVPLPRLQEQVLKGLSGPLTMIAAPAGFGKTTLVASSVKDCGMPVAWLSLDKNDNQAGSFLNYVIAALQEVDHEIGSDAAQWLSAPQVQPEAVLTSLINDLDTRGANVVLVLDDYQFICSQAVHDAVAFLLEHCPRTLHMVIATRSDPPLPIPRLRARNHVVELRAADLRFRGPEAAQFLNDIMGLHLDIEFIAILEERTEGWIAGLQMAALSMRGRDDILGFIEGFSGTNRYILDFLLEEALASQSPEIQHFLLYTSVLDRLTARLCNAVLAGTEDLTAEGNDPSTCIESISSQGSASTLDYLERANLFLVPLDDERTWYRYHHLFADLLASRLRQLDPQMIPQLHSRASVWYEQNGWLYQAIEHAFSAGDLDRAAQLIASNSQKLVYQVPFATIQNWIDQLPEGVVLQEVWIGLAQGWLWVATGRIGSLSGWMDKVEERFLADENGHSQAEQQDIQANIASLRAYDAFFRGDLQRCASLSHQALQLLSPSNLDLRVRILVQLGETLLALQELHQARTYLQEAVETGLAVEDFQSVTTASMRLYKVFRMLGQLNDAEEMVRRVLQALSSAGRGSSPVLTKLEQCWGDLLLERGQIAEANVQLKQALYHAQQYNTPLDIITSLIYRSAWLTCQLDLDAAQKVLEDAESFIRSFTIPPVIIRSWSLQRARVYMEKGELNNAQRCIGDPIHEESRILQARLLFKKGELEKAQSMLAELEKDTTAGQRHGNLIPVLLLQASVLNALGERSVALEALARCLTLAHSQAYLMTFLDGGEPAYDLLQALQNLSLPQPLVVYVLRILQAFEQRREQGLSRLESEIRVGIAPDRASRNGDPTVKVGQGLVEPLSQRELEVLSLLAWGKTNQEIAQQLVVAPGTVKAHTASIYRKLDVTNRTEAVAHARQLGILP